MRRSSLTTSAGFHIMMVILSIVGLPFLSRHEFNIPPPIVVDFIDISKVTETNKVSPQPVQKPEKEEPKQDQKPPAAAKNTAEEAVVPVAKNMAKDDDKKDVKPKEEALPNPKAPPEKVKKKKEEESKKAPSKDFSSVLKNLAAQGDAQSAKAENPSDKAPPGQNAPLGAKMTMSEQDALRSQLEKCWNVPFGAKDAENMTVDIFMVINRDRTLREARVVDTFRYNSDSFFRAAADSALRAVRSPLCSPFSLPPDKYDVWNRTTVSFNPKDMF